MSKRRQIIRGLLNNSAAAYFTAIELHNKPNISYRLAVWQISLCL